MMVTVTERKVSQYMTENPTLVLSDVEFNFMSSNKNMIGNFVKKYGKETELPIGREIIQCLISEKQIKLQTHFGMKI